MPEDTHIGYLEINAGNQRRLRYRGIAGAAAGFGQQSLSPEIEIQLFTCYRKQDAALRQLQRPADSNRTTLRYVAFGLLAPDHLYGHGITERGTELIALHWRTTGRRHRWQQYFFETERHCLGSRLVERLGQAGGQPDQIRIDHQISAAFPDAHLTTVVNRPRQAVEDRQIRLLAQLPDTDRAVSRNQYLAVGLGAALDLERPAKQRGVDFRHPQILITELQGAIHLLQRRQTRVNGDFVRLKMINALGL